MHELMWAIIIVLVAIITAVLIALKLFNKHQLCFKTDEVHYSCYDCKDREECWK